MANFYCEFCGTKASSISSLTSSSCHRHPSGTGKGKHKLYEGSEKAKYNCKYCGTSSASIKNLVTSSCHRHPERNSEKKHSVAL